MGHSDSALPWESEFTRRFDNFTEQPPGVCGRSIEVIYRANLRLFRTLGLIPAAEGIPKSTGKGTKMQRVLGARR